MQVRLLLRVFLTPLCLTLWFNCKDARASGEERIAVIIGSNIGLPGDEPLSYAERDARRVRDLMVDLGGVTKNLAITRFRGSSKMVLDALEEARQRAAQARAAGRRVTLFFYFSGHGDNATLHLPRGALTLSRLRQAVAKVPAAVRISVIDACRTSRVSKGVRRGPAFALSLNEHAPRGMVELRSSSAGEVAQESKGLSGSIFTHYLVSGLRGGADANGDGGVTLAEIYSHVYRRTLVHSLKGGALQHPSIAMKTGGSGEILLTRLARSRASLQVPGDADRYLIYRRRTAEVMGELTRGGKTKIALPTGRFIVARQRDARMSVAEVDLSWGGNRRLNKRDFRPITHEEFAVRGNTIEFRPMQIEVQAGVEVSPISAEELALSTGVLLSYVRGSLVLSAGMNLILGEMETAGYSGSNRAIAGTAALGWRWFMGLLTLSTHLGAEFRYGWQELTLHDQQRAQKAGFPVDHDLSYGAIGPRLGLRFAIPLRWNLAAALDITGIGLLRRETDGQEATITFRPAIFTALGLGYSF